MKNENDDDVRRHYHIEGMVQGVGFRWWTARIAREAGVRGFVRNRIDGAVEVEVAGDRRAVERFRAALAEGPPHARVEHIRELAPTDDPLPDPFAITR